MKANRFCVVRGHENTVASRICTFQNCDNYSRWLCSECFIEKLHKHDQNNKDHIMKQQEFSDLILDSSQIHLNQINLINQSISRLKYIVQCSTNLIYQLEEQFKKLSIQLIDYKNLYHQIKEDFLSIDGQRINQIVELQQNPDFFKSQNLKELQSKIYQILKFLMKMNSKCVLIGSPSSGKTTIFNKICELKQKKVLEPTKEITQSESKSGIGFTLIDTPGVPAIHDTFNDCLRIIGALTEHPINRILLIINYSVSLDNILTEIRSFVQVLSEYQQLIIIIINLRSLIIDDEKQRVIKRIITENFKINTILFYDSQSSKEFLCSSIDQQLNLYPQQLQFSNQKFFYLMKSTQLDLKLQKFYLFSYKLRQE